MVDMLKSLDDPRLPVYFQEAEAGGYIGAAPGLRADYAAFSPMGALLHTAPVPSFLLSYSEVRFLLAEAKQRGWNVTGTAAEHYYAGIRAAMEEWNIEEADIDAYVANPKVAFDPVNWKKTIGIQKWIAFFDRGADGWTDIRRLDFPALEVPDNAFSGYPVRYRYPVSEQNINRRNYEAAAKAIGGDVVETKLWWDKF